MLSVDKKLNLALAHALILFAVMSWLTFVGNYRDVEDTTVISQAILTLLLAGMAANLVILGYVYYKVHEESKGRMAALADLELQKEEMNTLGETAQYLQSCRTSEEIGSGLLPVMFFLFPDTVVHAFSKEDALEHLHILTSSNEFENNISLNPEDCWGLRKGKAHHSLGVASPGRCLHLGVNTQWALCLPLVARGELLGMLSLEKNNIPKNSDRITDLAVILSEQTAMAMANLKLRANLESRSMRDPLTNLYNRRYLQEALKREVATSQRMGKPLCLAMLDIDHFKDFNDKYGHEAGDAVLLGVAKQLTDSVRATDTVCRYGGEEIIVLLPDSNIQQATTFAEHFRFLLSQKHFTQNDQMLPPVTVSVGLAVYPENSSEINDIIKMADQAMYRAKQRGRNQVVAYSEP